MTDIKQTQTTSDECLKKLRDDGAFRGELIQLVNKHSLENISGGTPDFIVADYIIRCLRNFGETVSARSKYIS